MISLPSELIKKAKQDFSTADYMKTINFPLTNDKNMLFSILSYADNSVLLAIKAFLTHEKLKKRLKFLPVSEELLRKIFFEEYGKLLKITAEEKKILEELNAILKAHKQNEIEFQRGEELVIVLNNYKAITIKQSSITKYLSVVQALINKIEGMIK